MKEAGERGENGLKQKRERRTKKERENDKTGEKCRKMIEIH